MKFNQVTAVSLLVSLVVGGCASTTMSNRSQVSSKKYPRPEHIVVHDFAATAADIAADPALAGHATGGAAMQSPEDVAVGRKLGALVAQELVAEIRAMGLPGVRAGEQRPVVGDLVLKGYFESIEEGSAAKRVALGFGSGASDLRTSVKGFEMTANGLREVGSAEFDSGGSKSPGMLVPVAVVVATANPVGLVVGGAVKAHGEMTGSAGIEGAAKRTAEEIGKELRVAFKRQGWL